MPKLLNLDFEKHLIDDFSPVLKINKCTPILPILGENPTQNTFLNFRTKGGGLLFFSKNAHFKKLKTF